MKLVAGTEPLLLLNRSERSEAGLPSFLERLDLAIQPADFADMWQHVVDGLTEQIALLDEDWTILVVNRSWARVAELYGHSALIPGTDYLQFCREMAAGGLEIARDVVAGIEQIIDGTRSSFQLVYRASDPEEGHDHQLCVNRFEVGGRRFASITRYDVTRLIELRRLREDFSHSVILSQADERRRIVEAPAQCWRQHVHVLVGRDTAQQDHPPVRIQTLRQVGEVPLQRFAIAHVARGDVRSRELL